MNIFRYLCLLAALLIPELLQAQFNPTNPPEPGGYVKRYNLTTTILPSGSGYTTGSGSYAEGEEVTLSARQYASYTFTAWEDAEGNVISTSPTFKYTMPAKEIRLTARFKYNPSSPSEPAPMPEYQSVSIRVNPSAAGYTQGEGRYLVGESVYLRAYAYSNYQFVNFTLGDEVISTDPSFNYVVRKGDNNLTANYRYNPASPGEPQTPERKFRLQLHSAPSGAGYCNIPSGNEYAADTPITLRAYAYNQYSFISWTDSEGNVVSTSPSFTYSMPAAHTSLTVNYKYNPVNPSEPAEPTPRRNVIYGSRISVQPASEAFFDISLENTDEITGISVDVTMPEGYTADYSRATLGARAQAHTISGQDVDATTRRIFIRGTETFSGGSGIVIRIPVTVPLSAEPGSAVTVTLSKGVVIKNDGSQATAEATDGIIRISEEEISLPDSPDFVIRNVAADSADVQPGDTVYVRWQVANEGNIDATAGWSETIWIADTNGKRTKLGSLTYDTDRLAVKESVSRSATLAVPALPGLDGPLNVMVTLTPYASAGEIEQLQVNNAAITSATPINLAKTLLLEMPNSFTEGTDTSVRCRLSRSGSWMQSRTFTLSVEGDSRLRIPESVTIPKDMSGVYFMATIEDNNILDDSADFTLTVTGDDYPEITREITVIDDEYPDIELKFSADHITEGDVSTLTVTLPRANKEDVTVTLSSDAPGRFEMPESIIIPAGSRSATVEVKAIDNDEIENPVDVSFFGRAPHYSDGETFTILADNDMPLLELQLTPAEVSEGAGPRAIRGTLRRLTNTANRITVVFSDNAPDNLIYDNRIVLDEGVEETDFNIGVVDNTRVDGDRDITLSASVFIRICSCSASGENGGKVSKTITIVDNDGPSLSLASSAATLRRDYRSTTLTVKRNTSTASPMTVSLTATPEGLLEMPATLTIPAGAESAEIRVDAPESSFTGEEHAITLNALCDGFAKGTTLLLISDRTLPDATVTLARRGEDEIYPGMRLTLAATVANEGNAAMPDAAPVELYLSDSTEPAAAGHTSRTLQPGESETVLIQYEAPKVPGTYSLSVHVNDNDSFRELTRTNNTSAALPVEVKSPFSAIISVSRESILPGEKITLTGMAPGYGDQLEIYYITAGARRTAKATPDNEGRFTIDIDPIYSGDYIAGVCIPGENKSEEMTSFTVRGMSIDNGAYSTVDIASGDTYNIPLAIANSSAMPLTGIKSEITGLPEECSAEITDIADIAARGTGTATLSLTATGISQTDDWQRFELRLTSADGASATKNIYFHSRPNTATLLASVSAISTTMTMGQQRAYRFVISNNGKGDSGDISLSLPAFMQKGTATTIPSLAFGETACVDIILTPSPEMQLNVPVNGKIGINCANGTGLALPFSITPVSDLTGRLIVDVKDEYTFRTAEAPHVADADIIVSHPVSGKLIAAGKSDADGLWEATLPEGFYTLEVSASRHDSWKGNIQIAPGKDNDTPVFISFNAISYDWKVEETTVDDTYDIVTTVEYETRVPKPVVVVDFPKLSYRNQIVYVSVTNKGLIAAENVEIILPAPTEEFRMQVIGDAIIPRLVAGENRMVPVRVTVDEEDKYPEFKMTTSSYSFTGSYAGEENQPSAVSGKVMAKAPHRSGCFATKTVVAIPQKECDPTTGEAKSNGKYDYVEANYYSGSCGRPSTWPTQGANFPSVPALPSSPGGGPGSGNGGHGGNNEETSLFWQDQVLNTLMTGCLSDCQKALADALDKCKDLLPFMPDSSCLPGFLEDCMPGAVTDNSSALDCAISGAGCIPGPISKGSGWAACAKAAYEAFEKCLEANRRYKNKHIPAHNGMRTAAMQDADNAGDTSASEDDSDAKLDAMEQRANTVRLYYSYVEALNDNMYNILGSDGWTGMKKEDMRAMFTFLKSVRNDKGYLPTGDAILAGKPASVSLDTYLTFVDRFNNTVRYGATGEVADNMIDLDKLVLFKETLTDIRLQTEKMGFPSFEAFMKAASEDLDYFDKLTEQPSEGVCASITLKFRQTMVMTRQAFRGTLTVTNGNEEVRMTNIKLKVKVRDAEGNLTGDREFAVSTESLDGFEGALALDAGWSLDAKGTGEVTVLFIPSKYAAPIEPLVYSFGGTLSYTDPFTGSDVAIELSPIEMTVSPSPVLDLHYFMQRDVIGDDPLTEQRIESSEPAEFALLISNHGYGDAANLRMTTSQPEIVENLKGLAIDFAIVESSLNGRRSTMAIGERIPTEFGTLPALSTAYAQWWLKASLMGHFTSYNVQATQVSSYGSEEMSLLDKVEIHELIHGFTPDCETSSGNPDETPRAFLVNDIEDNDRTPDSVWMSMTGNAEDVAKSSSASISDYADDSCTLHVGGMKGWTYGKLATPWKGRRNIVKAVRLSDGKELPADNFWTTFVTLENSAAPKYEDKIHFIVNLAGDSESYLLTLEPEPESRLAVTGFEGVPEEGEIRTSPLTQVAVCFNKPIDESTFEAEDITIVCQGEKVTGNAVRITPAHTQEAPVRYLLDITSLTTSSGYYTLTVDAATITDTEGFNGSEMARAAWIQLADGKLRVSAIAAPSEGGIVEPESAEIPYGASLELSATPAEGYRFTKWTLGNDILSQNPTFDFTPTEDAALSAVFTLTEHSVNVEYDHGLCTVYGADTGIFNYGTELSLIAEPTLGATFVRWENEAGETLSTDPLLHWTVKGEATLRAVVKQTSTGADSLRSNGVTRVYPVPTRTRLYIDGDFGTLESVSIISVHGTTERIVKGLTPGTPLNVENLESGIYLVRITTERGHSVHRIVKI